ncbi:MAG: PepSY domain-containing protein [Candidatus Sericytochromatia bacterium]
MPAFQHLPRLLRRAVDLFHRYIGLLAFGQVFLWSLSGFLMYSLDFSDLYREPPPAPLPVASAGLSPEALQARLKSLKPKSHLTGIAVRNLGGQLAYQLSHSGGPPVLLNAQGLQINPISPELAARVAKMGYTGTGQAQQTDLLPKSEGNYMSGQPIYRVRFDDDQQTEIYIDPETGSLLARRKALWALYNRMWEFHLMKYTPWAGVNKSLLLIFAVLNALVALTGLLKFFRWGYRMRRDTSASRT